MKLNVFFETMGINGNALYNARTAVRTFLVWKTKKALKENFDLDALDISKLHLTEAEISAFASESRTFRNHAVTLRKILKFKNEQYPADNPNPKFLIHKSQAEAFLTQLKEREVSIKEVAHSLNLTPFAINRLLTDWTYLDKPTAARIDAYSHRNGHPSNFSNNIPVSLKVSKLVDLKPVPTYKFSDLPPDIKEFVENVEKYLTESRTNYDNCDTGQSIRRPTADGLVSNLKNFYKFCAFEIPWFFEEYKKHFGEDFKAVLREDLKTEHLTYRLIFDRTLMRFYCRYFKAFKSFYRRDMMMKFKGGANTASSVSAVETLRTLFNRNGYIYLASESKTIQQQLNLTDDDLKSWKQLCKSAWDAMGDLDSICRSQKVVINPRNPNTTRDDEELAILERVLKMDNPLLAIFKLNNQISSMLSELDPKSKTAIDLKEMLFVSKFLTLLPLRAKNLCALHLCQNTGQLDAEQKKTHLQLATNFQTSKIYVHADEVKNGKALGPINRSIPRLLFDLLHNRFGKVEDVRPMLNLDAVEINNYFNSLSRTLLPDLFPKGLTIHCFRHIVASTIIKADPSGYAIAAQLLHDTIAQIEKTYGFKRQDQHVHAYYNSSYLGSMFL